jgi:hypothetical protein
MAGAIYHEAMTPHEAERSLAEVGLNSREIRFLREFFDLLEHWERELAGGEQKPANRDECE